MRHTLQQGERPHVDHYDHRERDAHSDHGDQHALPISVASPITVSTSSALRFGSVEH